MTSNIIHDEFWTEHFEAHTLEYANYGKIEATWGVFERGNPDWIYSRKGVGDLIAVLRRDARVLDAFGHSAQAKELIDLADQMHGELAALSEAPPGGE